MNKQGCLAIVLCLCATLPTEASGPRVNTNPDSRLIADFGARVTDYVNLHKKAESGLPPSKPSPSPEEITQRQKDLAERIRALRPGATQGEIFSPEIRKEFRRLVSIAWKGADARRMRASLDNSEPVRIPLKVNDHYPAQVPLQSTPPTLLQNLPRLPKELEYRVVGRSIVLRDIPADLIVDFIDGIVP